MLLNFNNKPKGQSTVEYIIVVAAVLSVLIVFFGPGGLFRKSFVTSLNMTTDGMTEMAGRMVSARRSNPNIPMTPPLP